MAQLTAEQRKYIRIETIISIVFNTVIGSIFAWLVASHSQGGVPLWGAAGMAADFVPTILMSTLVMSLVVTGMTYKRVAAGKAPGLEPAQGGWLAWAPRNFILRSVIYAVIFTVIVVPLSVGALVALGLTTFPVSGFVPFKAIYTALFTLLVGPGVVQAAMVRRA